jgi:hypothetical protein
VISALGRATVGLRWLDTRGLRTIAALLVVIVAAEGVRLFLVAPSDAARYGAGYLITLTVLLIPGAVGKSGDGRRTTPSPSTAAISQIEDVDPRRTPAQGVMILIATTTGFILALPWIGFALSALLFLFIYFRWISKVSLARAAVYATLTSVILAGAFIALSVRMPHGVLGLPF